jgi:hypothetical protein
MENQIPPSNVPGATEPLEGNPMPFLQNISPQQLEELKARAREAAIRMSVEQAQAPRPPQVAPQVVYVRRNLTVAELLIVFVISCGLVTGIQVGWNFATNLIPRIEIKLK